MNALTSSLWTDSTRKGIKSLCWAPCVYHLSTWSYRMLPDLPSLPSAVFAYCKQSTTDGGNGLGTRLILTYKFSGNGLGTRLILTYKFSGNGLGTRLILTYKFSGNGLGTRLILTYKFSGNGLGTRLILTCKCYHMGMSNLSQNVW